MTRSELEWDVNASTSREVATLLAFQFTLVGGLILLVGTSLLLALTNRYATGTGIVEFVGILVFVTAVPILFFWAVLRTLAGAGIKRTLALYYFYDPAHPERTIFDHAPPWQYVAVATVGLFGYLGAIFVVGLGSIIVTLAVASALFCYFLWWTIPNRGRLDVESETLVVYNRRTLTEGGSASTQNLIRGFNNDDRRTSLEDVVGLRALPIGDIVILALRHHSGHTPTLVVVPPRVADRLIREYRS